MSVGWLAAHGDGKSLSEVLGKTDFDIFGQQRAAAAFAGEQRIIATGKPMVAKLERATFNDRADTWTTTTKLPLLDQSGTIVGTLGLSRDITDQVQAQQTLSDQALHDSVTGLVNRVALMDRLRQALAWLESRSDRLALLVVDLDDFKSVNDTLAIDQ